MTVVPGSTVAFPTASWARRVLALFVDWILSTLVVVAFAGVDWLSDAHTTITDLAPLLVFVLESALLTVLLGGSFGQLATRLRVVPAKGYGNLHNPLTLLARQAAIALVIPPLVFRADGRGLHDLLAGTATVTLDTYRQLTTSGI